MIKSVARIVDTVLVASGVSSTKSAQRGIRLPDGAPVPIDTIMREFGVSKEEAENIAQRKP